MEEDNIALFGGEIKAPGFLADIVESIAAVVYIDLGFDINAFWMVFMGVLEPIVTWEFLQEQPQPESELIKLCQKQKKQVHLKQWREKSVNFARFYVDDELVGSGSSSQKHIAKFNAAKEALRTLEEITMLVDEVTTVAFDVYDNIEIIGARQKLFQICCSKKLPKPSYRVEKEEKPSRGKYRYICSVQVKVEEAVLFMQGDERSKVNHAENSAASYMIYSLLESASVQRRTSQVKNRS